MRHLRPCGNAAAGTRRRLRWVLSQHDKAGCLGYRDARPRGDDGGAGSGDDQDFPDAAAGGGFGVAVAALGVAMAGHWLRGPTLIGQAAGRPRSWCWPFGRGLGRSWRWA